jgi:hypothetical protein
VIGGGDFMGRKLLLTAPPVRVGRNRVDRYLEDARQEWSSTLLNQHLACGPVGVVARRGSAGGAAARAGSRQNSVVVTGVLVALAASDQAQRAQERKLANEFAARIIEDLDRLSRSIRLVLGWSSAVEASGAVLLSVLEDEAPIADSLLLLTAAYQASRMPHPDLSAIAYGELLATGQIRLFRDGTLRQALGGYFADLERAESFLAGYLPSILRPCGEHFRFRFSTVFASAAGYR